VANRAKTPFNASAILPGIDDALVDGLSARYWIVSPE
jgi:hypothetical protein